MDEWDDFLTKRSASSANLDEEQPTESCDATAAVVQIDLGEYTDNAEVFLQVSRGESLTQMSEGIFIRQQPASIPKQQWPTLKPQKQSAPIQSSSSVPVANSLSDLAKLLPGHPRLSHPLTSVVDRESIKALLSATVEVETLMLFFYGAAKDLKVESDCCVDYAEGAEFKARLIGQNLLDSEDAISGDLGVCVDDSRLLVSLDNLRLLCGAIPPLGKSPFLIPFQVNEAGQVDLSASALVSDFTSGNTVDSLVRLYRRRLEGKVAAAAAPFTTKVCIGESCKVAVFGKRPLFNVNVAFRGALHPDPLHDAVSSLFYRQPNYHVSVEAETGLVKDLRVYVPRLDAQAKVFALLPMLSDKLSRLAAHRQYFLLHVAGAPNLKVLEANPSGTFDVNLFKF